MRSISILTWEIFQKIAQKYLKTTFSSLDNYIIYLANNGTSIKWHRLQNWETLDDERIFNNIERLKNPVGKLYIITEASYKNHLGPFELDASDIREFIIKHIQKYGESFFNGDVIIFSFNYNIAWCFHHEGLYSLIRLNEDGSVRIGKSSDGRTIKVHQDLKGNIHGYPVDQDQNSDEL